MDAKTVTLHPDLLLSASCLFPVHSIEWSANDLCAVSILYGTCALQVSIIIIIIINNAKITSHP
jgi:hypothetical protein